MFTVGGAQFTVGGAQFTVGGAVFTVGGATQTQNCYGPPMGPKYEEEEKTGFDKIIVLIMKEVKSDENKVQKKYLINGKKGSSFCNRLQYEELSLQ